MGVYIPGFNPINTIVKRIKNVPYILDNIASKIKFNYKKLTYDDIIRVEYECIETPEFIFEDMCVDRTIEKKKTLCSKF